MQRKPEIGDNIYYFPPKEDSQAKSNFNEGVVPGIITRVWSGGVINMKVFPDSGPVGDRTSVNHASLTQGTRSWFYPGEYPLDEKGIPIFAAGAPELCPKEDTLRTGL